MARETTPPIDTLIEQLHATDWMVYCDAALLPGQSRNPSAVKDLFQRTNYRNRSGM
ncbi:MAG TPA: hypothetical protein VFY26_16240 [Anaerolineales bacterium]|nr:hypothetical protein [Anaerolineales bacterium]